MRSKEAFANPSETFKMDKWMLRFLMEFSAPVEERQHDVANHAGDLSQEMEWNAISDGVQYDFRDWTGNTLGIDLDNVNSWNKAQEFGVRQ